MCVIFFEKVFLPRETTVFKLFWAFQFRVSFLGNISIFLESLKSVFQLKSSLNCTFAEGGKRSFGEFWVGSEGVLVEIEKGF